jgi:hypothetical protein
MMNKMKTEGYKAGGKMAAGGAVKKAMGMKKGGKISADMVSPRKAMAMGMKSGGKVSGKGC